MKETIITFNGEYPEGYFTHDLIKDIAITNINAILDMYKKLKLDYKELKKHDLIININGVDMFKTDMYSIISGDSKTDGKAKR